MAKQQKDYTIGELIAKKPIWFIQKQTLRLGDDEILPTEIEKTLSLIHKILDAGFNHLASYPLYAVFGTFNITSMPTPDIRKAMATFNYDTWKLSQQAIQQTTNTDASTTISLEQTSGNYPKIKVKTPSFISNKETLGYLKSRNKTIKDLFGIDTAAYEQRVETAKREIKNKLGRIKDIESQIEDYLRSLDTTYKELEASETSLETATTTLERIKNRKVCPDKIKIANALKNDPNWLLVQFGSGEFTVMNRKPIVMNFINQASGIGKSLPMGFYTFSFYISSMRIRSIRAVGDNIILPSNHRHPHISGDSFCFGNVRHRADDAAKNRDITALLGIIYSVLTTYCPDNPYRTFEAFNRAKNSGYEAIRDSSFSENSDIVAYVVANAYDRKKMIEEVEKLLNDRPYWLKDDGIRTLKSVLGIADKPRLVFRDADEAREYLVRAKTRKEYKAKQRRLEQARGETKEERYLRELELRDKHAENYVENVWDDLLGVSDETEIDRVEAAVSSNEIPF